jgi:hypothetical protein
MKRVSEFTHAMDHIIALKVLICVILHPAKLMRKQLTKKTRELAGLLYF